MERRIAASRASRYQARAQLRLRRDCAPYSLRFAAEELPEIRAILGIQGQQVRLEIQALPAILETREPQALPEIPVLRALREILVMVEPEEMEGAGEPEGL